MTPPSSTPLGRVRARAITRALRCLALIAVAGLASTPLRAQLVIPGSGAAEVLVRQLAQAFNDASRKERVQVPPSTGTSAGIRAVEQGEAGMARIGRILAAEETARGLRFVPLGTDAVVFAVGSDVPIKALRAGELAAIFSGQVENWSAVAGLSARIRVITREPTELSLTAIRRHVPQFRDVTITDRAKMVARDGEMLTMLESFATGIGFLTQVSLHGAKRPVRAIELDGVAPTLENIASQRYPILSHYGFVVRGTPSSEARAFLDFVASPEGQALIRKLGVMPAGRT